jgi:ACS family tartrate transporter-like MFS transporter
MDLEQRTIRKIRRRLLPLLVASGVVCYVDRVNVSFAAPGMMKDLGFTATIYGFGAGLLFLTYFLFEVPSNVMLTKFGARKWFCRIMLTWGVIAGATAFVIGEYSFYALRLLLGAAEAGMFPGIMYFLTLWFPAKYRGGVVGIFYMALPLAGVVGGPISGPLLNLDGLAGLHGWQWLFIIEAIPAILLGLVVLALLPDNPGRATFLNAEENAWLKQQLEADKQASDVSHHNVLTALADWRVIVLGLICFCPSATNYGLSFFLPLIVKGFGLGNVQTGLVAAIPFVMGSLGCFLWGRHSDQTQERRFHLIGSLLAAGGFIALSTAFDAPLLQMIVITLAAFGLYSYLPPFWAMSSAYLAGAGAVGAAASIGAINAIANIGGFLAPYMFGFLKDATGTYKSGMLGLTGLCAVGIVLVLIFGYSVRPVARARPALRLRDAQSANGKR